MTTVRELVDDHGGMATTRQLRWAGAEERHLTEAVRSGEVVRVRNGRYTTLPPEDPRVLAVRVGGKLTGISLVQHLGGWVLNRHPVHLSVAPNAARLRDPLRRRHRRYRRDTRVRVHWEAPRDDTGSLMTVGLLDALVRVILDEPFEQAVAALDWALHTGRIDRDDLSVIVAQLPTRLQGIVEWVDPQCESLPESLARTRMRLVGLAVVSQARLPTAERIDLVVEGIVAVETDGDAYHREHFERDRLKDLEIAKAGFHGLRPSARAVFQRWDDVLDAVFAALATSAPLFVRETQDLPHQALLKARGRRGRPSTRAPLRLSFR